MILGFRTKETEAIWRGNFVKGVPTNIQPVARRKLRMLNNAKRLDDLRIPPANRLEALKGDRVGQHSIRINSQSRLCFRWSPAGAGDVEIVDYH